MDDWLQVIGTTVSDSPGKTYCVPQRDKCPSYNLLTRCTVIKSVTQNTTFMYRPLLSATGCHTAEAVPWIRVSEKQSIPIMLWTAREHAGHMYHSPCKCWCSCPFCNRLSTKLLKVLRTWAVACHNMEKVFHWVPVCKVRTRDCSSLCTSPFSPQSTLPRENIFL